MKHIENLEDFKTPKEVEELDIFDFDNIPMSELDKAYIDYEPLYDTVDLFSVDEDYLYEERENGCLALNHDETPSHIHTEPLCEIARINVRESGNGLFPYNKWELKVYSNDHTPPHFHVIADGWDVSFRIDNGELLVVNRKGRNDTIYQYMIDNIPKWLEANCAVLPIATNKQNANAVWKQIHTMNDDFSSKHRIDEMATISRPTDNIPRKSKVIVYGEEDEQGTKTPHFHVQIDNGDIELEIKFEHIKNMDIWRTKNNYPKSWNDITDVRDGIIEWLQRQNTDYPGFTNYIVLAKTWNQNNRDNQIDISKLNLDIAIKNII